MEVKEAVVGKKKKKDMFNESIRAAKRKSVEGGQMTRRKRRRKVKVWRGRR